MDSVDSEYGVDYENPATLHNDASHGVLTQVLQQEVDPLAVSSNHGIELYQEALSIITTYYYMTLLSPLFTIIKIILTILIIVNYYYFTPFIFIDINNN